MKSSNRWILIFLGVALVSFGLASMTLQTFNWDVLRETADEMRLSADSARAFETTGGESLASDGILEISVVDSDLRITTHPGDQVRWSFTGTYPMDRVPEIEMSGDERDRKIEVNYPNLVGIHIGSWSQLDLEIPESFAGNLEIQGTSNDAWIAPLVLNRLVIRTVSGDVTVEAPHVEAFSAESTSGHVILTKAEIGQARLESVSGDLELACEALGSLVLKSTSGDVSVKAPPITDLRLLLETISGDLSYEGRSDRIDRTGDRRLLVENGHGSREMRLTTVSGEIEWIEISP